MNSFFLVLENFDFENQNLSLLICRWFFRPVKFWMQSTVKPCFGQKPYSCTERLFKTSADETGKAVLKKPERLHSYRHLSWFSDYEDSNS